MVLDRVLGRDHHERLREPVSLVLDGDSAVRHGFKKSALSLGSRPIDLISQYDICEERTLPELEQVLHLVENRNTCQVGREKIAGELDSVKCAIEGTGQRVSQDRLPDTRHILDEKMAFGEKSDQSQSDDIGFASDDSLDRRLKGLDSVRHLSFDLC